MVSFDRKVRSLLAKTGRLQSEALDGAVQAAEQEKKALSSILIQRNLIHEKELLGLISHEMGLAPIDLDRIEIDPKLLEVVPQDIAQDHGVLPISKVGSILTIAVSDPTDVVRQDDLRIITGLSLRPVLSTPSSIERHIQRYYNPGEQEVNELFQGAVTGSDLELKEELEGEENLDITDLSEESSPVVRLVNLIIYQAIRDRASDVHIEPLERKTRVRYRLDGVMREAFAPPRKMHGALTSRIKIMSSLDIAEKKKPQDGKFQMRVEGRAIDFRVSILPTVFGEKIVLRVLDKSGLTMTMDGLGFEPKALEDFRKAVKCSYGMILLTGPTGSGKSTSLYAAVREIYTVEENFVTVEDPVEYQMDGVSQVNVNLKRGLTFAASLRSILRQDPDVIMIGEIRDKETIEIAVRAALTGHLVLSTLHTNDAPSTITRMVDMGLDPFLISSSVRLIAAQRLVRKLCENCKEEFQAPRERLLSLGFSEEECEGARLFRAVGCVRCGQGYRGRFALLETMPVSEEIKRMILRGGSALDIRDQAMKEGMISLRRCGIVNVIKGNTTVEEVLKVSSNEV